MMKATLNLLFLSLVLSSTGFAQTIVYAQGSFYTNRPSAEHIVLRIARNRMVADARNQCRSLGFTSEPVLVSGNGSCSASYANHAWSAHCESEFDCE